MPIATVPLAAVAVSRDIQLRPIDSYWIAHLDKCYKRGDRFPPIKAFYDGRRYWCYDGFHRLHLYRNRLSIKTVEVDWEPGSQPDAKLAAAGCNAEHGLPRRGCNIKAAVLRARGRITTNFFSFATGEQLSAIAAAARVTKTEAEYILERRRRIRRRSKKDISSRVKLNRSLSRHYRDWGFLNREKKKELREEWKLRRPAKRGIRVRPAHP